MKNAKALKLQYLIIHQLIEQGYVSLMLPDGVTLEIGITQEDRFGDLKKIEDYCYIVATSKDGRSVMMDTFNLGLQFPDHEDTIVCEDHVTDDDGTLVRTLDVV
jgi:hypothetical protein